jgi:hypothetical protein
MSRHESRKSLTGNLPVLSDNTARADQRLPSSPKKTTRRAMIHKVKTNKKYPFKQMQSGDTFKLNDDDIRSAQKMAWYYRTRCKRPITILIVKGDDGYHCQRID